VKSHSSQLTAPQYRERLYQEITNRRRETRKKEGGAAAGAAGGAPAGGAAGANGSTAGRSRKMSNAST
jgi:hypothetical protein